MNHNLFDDTTNSLKTCPFQDIDGWVEYVSFWRHANSDFSLVTYHARTVELDSRFVRKLITSKLHKK